MDAWSWDIAFISDEQVYGMTIGMSDWSSEEIKMLGDVDTDSIPYQKENAQRNKSKL